MWTPIPAIVQRFSFEAPSLAPWSEPARPTCPTTRWRRAFAPPRSSKPRLQWPGSARRSTVRTSALDHIGRGPKGSHLGVVPAAGALGPG